MAQVKLSIGGRSYDLACREGEEAHYETLARRIDAKAEDVRGAMGAIGETRLLLLTALLLADEVENQTPGTRPTPPAPAIDPRLVETMESFAARLESLSGKLENALTTP